MNQAIRSAWVVAISMFALVLGSLTYVQFFQAQELKENDWNSRQLYQDFGRQRGAILVDGRAIAESVPSNDQFNFQRVYNDPELYAHLTGYYSLSLGTTQLETAESAILSGTSSSLFYDRVVQLFSGVGTQGASVELTIDPEIQRLAWDLIPDGQRGSIVVMEPSTGNILAMVSKPSFDPNLLAVHDTSVILENAAALSEQPGLSIYTNPATQSLVSPGSVFKLVDAAAALESGEYDAESEIPNPPALEFPGIDYALPNYVTGNCASRATADLEFALEQSCNTPFAQIAIDLGEEAIQEQAARFGFGEQLSIPTDVTASVFPSDLSETELAQSAVGQFDTRVTPLQMAMVASAIANDGELMQPQLIKSVRAPDLELIDAPQPELLRRSVSEATANQLTDWMVNVVDNGTAAGAQIPGVRVAGKTGTAEVTETGDNAWFTGFAPAEDPQVALSIVMENVDIPTGQQLTSPSAKRLIEAVLNR
ncbi:penicillin-binding protein 2 [Arthrobacter agilis]|uniref:peptidoglycan D,D-transpeptidase FtsI family protein n=1 Tax=Arthrobacter agilis TaxID=37921 RepID=UPI000B34AE7C|nr:penicillin-binding protein 2 [Arthrobacter agilis]OUM42316.1 peptidoglycan glycosyltransferase [Arthrobacter agilis]PPB45659.1 penicillin-binding protein 2 [Arthrobacter agilis]TPV26359.1 penicillin-binding protein 2 [Arthrobacter agilis]VDR30773.1 Penicillin-binding protein A [Arthrobacter agilis]